MTDYSAILHALGHPVAARMSTATVAESLDVDGFPPWWYGCPPAVVPILSDGSFASYVGVWRHWFLPRADTFVAHVVGDDHRTDEIARTEAQLTARAVLEMLSAHDGIDDEVRALARTLGIGALGLRRLDRHSERYGDDPAEFARLATFRTRTPLESVDDTARYDGEFPTETQHRYATTCYFEHAPGSLTDRDDLPPWLDPAGDKASTFEAYLAAGRLDAAWLTLNGTGWTYRDAATALAALVAAAPRDPLFADVAAAWIGCASIDGAGGY